MQEWMGADPSARSVDIRLTFEVQGRIRRLMKEAEAHLTEIERMQEQEGEPIDLPIVPFRTPLI